MAPSQLKQLKASLREQGLVGPQQSKKQKQHNGKTGVVKRAQREAALGNIREQFNPFEFRAPGRTPKFDVTSNKSFGNKERTDTRGRPGVTRGLGEERRRETLLKDMQRRNKTGGLFDRRFGENDPSMMPEQRAAERYAREVQRSSKNATLFDLEEDDGDLQLTHGGRSLTFDEAEDFKEPDVLEFDADRDDSDESRHRKRLRLSDTDVYPERKKTKDEVMKEVIAKSKLHKYERQQAKEDDDDLRMELDKDLPTLFSLLAKPHALHHSTALQPDSHEAHLDPGRAALLEGKDRAEADREYDERLRQMVFDKRSQPAERTKTQEELAAQDAQRLQILEKERLRRMQGDEQSGSGVREEVDGYEFPESDHDDAEAFGLRPVDSFRSNLGAEDEDDFIIDDDLIASGSELGSELGSVLDGDSDSSQPTGLDDDDDDHEFTHGLSLPLGDLPTASRRRGQLESDSSNLSYTFLCPQSLNELVKFTSGISHQEVPTAIQRIRALYNPKLGGDNRQRMERFSSVLVDFVVHLANAPDHPPFAVLEALLRHLHSLARSHPQSTATAFRSHLRDMSEHRPFSLVAGDLILLTGVATMFPTSDHFHPVVTLASMTIARYLGQCEIQSLHDSAIGAYLCVLSLSFQRLSPRCLPEFMNYTITALHHLAPLHVTNDLHIKPYRSIATLPPCTMASVEPGRVCFWDGYRRLTDTSDSTKLRARLLAAFVRLADSASTSWAGKSAFHEIVQPILCALKGILAPGAVELLPAWLRNTAQKCLQKLEILSQQSLQARRPLVLHKHRPLAIKMSIPKFEESFNPDRHYDPDRERSEINKLKAEHKRERKGALRELRKDASFIARENLREKKEKDAAYEKKYKRLIAEIQSEEGREANEYDRIKRARKGR